jgi:hypothetical protein
MLKKLLNLFKDEVSPKYGWSIFVLDDRIHLTRRVTEAQRKQMQHLS